MAHLAERQYGVVARYQLAALGLSLGAIQRRIENGFLHQIHRGVFALGHRNLTLRGHWMAAVLAAGEGALLSYRSGGALWDVMAAIGGKIDVTTGTGSRLDTDRIIKHRARNLCEDDRAEVDGIPVTSLARTLLDLASVLPRQRLEMALERGEKAHGLDVLAIRAACSRNGGHRGARRLLSMIGQLDDAPDYRSELERRFGRFCSRHSLPSPSFNASVEGVVVDALWPRQRLIVELDSWEHHRTKQAFERDRARDVPLQMAGYRVVRLTWKRLQDEPATVAAELRALLTARSS